MMPTNTFARRERHMTRSNLGKILLAGAAFGLTACGGGGSSLNSTPTPTPIPTPTPPPAPPPGFPPLIFPSVTTSTDFAVIGIEASNDSSPTMTTAGFSVRYDAPSGTYILDFPSTQPAAFYAYTDDPLNESVWNGTVGDHEATVWKPTNPDLQLTYTTLATYGTYSQGLVPAFGWLAFGSATPAGGVPAAGTATYSAEVAGSTIDRFHWVGGTATLQFDFGAGTLAGHFDPVFESSNTPLGRYDFVNSVYGSGSTTFSGQLSTAGIAQNGTFDGQFTGPIAQELMARWSAPFIDPVTAQQSTMFGVWVGKN